MNGCFTFLVVLVIAILSFPHATQSKNILVWGAVGSHSIRLSMTPFMEALVEKGHNVTFITAFEDMEVDPKKKSKINTYAPKKWKEAMGASWETEDVNYFDPRKTFYRYGVPKVWYDVRGLGILSCECFYTDPEFLEWVKSSPKYDLVVVEMLVNECAFGLAHLWGSKVVIYSTTSVIPGFHDAHGIPDESSSVSDIFFGFPPGNEMSFVERFINAFHSIFFTLTKEYYFYPVIEEITRKGFKELGIDENRVPSFSEVEKNVSLVLLTSHYSLDYPRSFPPNVIPIGGSVVSKTKKPMSKEMEDFVNSAKDGFIYISFGTVADFVNFDESTKLEFVKAIEQEQFSKLKFLWKLTSKINITLPNNVMVTPWAPQQTVLDHPNIKAFISHSGMGGITEAIHFSVPLICLPILAEQDHNAQVIASKGAGIKLEAVGLKQEHLQNAISEILHNPKYRKAMTTLTRIFKDRPTPPLETAIWWIEYILRHDDTNDFLVPPSVRQPWWKRRQIDIWLTAALLLGAIVAIPLLIIYNLLKSILLIGLPKPETKDKNQSKKSKRD